MSERLEVRLDAVLLRAVEAECVRLGQSRATFVRRALEQALSSPPAVPGGVGVARELQERPPGEPVVVPPRIARRYWSS